MAGGPRFSSGRPRKLTRSQERRLLRILLKGAIANDYRTELWTRKRVAGVIQRPFTYDNIAQEEVCVFLRDLLRHLRCPVIVLLDNSSTHQGDPGELLRRHPRLCKSSRAKIKTKAKRRSFLKPRNAN
jgi:hypothetical protein